METIANKSNIEDQLEKIAQFILDADADCRIKVTKKSNGTLPLLKLWRMWMADIAEYLAARGRKMPLGMDSEGNWYGSRPINADDAHEAYSYLCLGCDESGNRYSWVVNSDKYDGRVAAPLGVRIRAMDKIYKQAMDEGIPLRIPKNTEYEKLKDG